jgi:GNAT superfamily N-acetyltransferase
MHLRRATPEEATIVQDLLHRAYAANAAAGFNFTAATVDLKTVRETIETEETYLLLDGGAVVGTFTLRNESEDRRFGVFGWFAVDPARRGQGLGARLLAYGEERARARGWQRLRLDTPVNHPWLPAFYQRHGFVPVGTVHWEGKTYDSVVMERLIQPRSQ